MVTNNKQKCNYLILVFIKVFFELWPKGLCLLGHVRADGAARRPSQHQLRKEAHHCLPGGLPNQP